jgi:hypothetical protein
MFVRIVSNAQQYSNVTDETITVNSKTSLSGSTRNITNVELPEKTIGFIYRISTFSRGNADVDNSLFKLVKSVEPSTALVTSLMEFAIKNNDGNSLDAFIFNNTYDADNFAAKKDGNWTACKSMMNRGNCCFPTKDCLNHRIYFGFRNNNISQGLDVKLEVVAIIDTVKGKAQTYSYTLLNSTANELKFYVSYNDTAWTINSLRANYQATFTFEKPVIYVKIYTNAMSFVHYKLTPDNRYKFVFNVQTRKWDVIYY